jgi:hypothetical protein
MLVLTTMLLATAGRLPAQGGGGRGDSTMAGKCWRGKPAPICDNFFLTEFGVARVLTSSTSHFDVDYGSAGGGLVHYSEPDFGNRLQFTIGPMFNQGPRRAIGGTVSFNAVHNGFRAAFEGRHRWWGPGYTALDLSAGAMRIDEPSVSAIARRTEYGVTAGVHLLSNDLVNATTRSDITFGHGGARVGMSVGLGVGGWLTLLVAPLGLIVDGFAHAAGGDVR